MSRSLSSIASESVALLLKSCTHRDGENGVPTVDAGSWAFAITLFRIGAAAVGVNDVALITDVDANNASEAGISSNGDGESVVALHPSLDVAMVIGSKPDVSALAAADRRAMRNNDDGDNGEDGSHEFENSADLSH